MQGNCISHTESKLGYAETLPRVFHCLTVHGTVDMERRWWLLVALATVLLLEACLAKPQYPYADPYDDARFFHKKKKKKPLLGSDCKGRTFVYVYNQITGGGGHGGGDGLGEGDADGDDVDADGDDDGGDLSDTQNDCGGGAGGLLGPGGLLGGLLGSNGGGTRQTFPLSVRPQRYLRYFYRAIRPLYRLF